MKIPLEFLTDLHISEHLKLRFVIPMNTLIVGAYRRDEGKGKIGDLVAVEKQRQSNSNKECD